MFFVIISTFQFNREKGETNNEIPSLPTGRVSTLRVNVVQSGSSPFVNVQGGWTMTPMNLTGLSVRKMEIVTYLSQGHTGNTMECVGVSVGRRE